MGVEPTGFTFPCTPGGGLSTRIFEQEFAAIAKIVASDFHEQRTNQCEVGKLIRKPGSQEWKREDIQNSSSWFPGFLIKKFRSVP
jgi:hypothetical protein